MSSEAPGSPSRSVRRRVLRAGLLYVLTPYVFIVALAAVFQRSLIYHPTKRARIDVDEAGLPSGRVHAIAVPTNDGLNLAGWCVLAIGRRAVDEAACQRELTAGRPLVIYFCGNAGNRSHRTAVLELLSRLGADVMIVDYRGYGENAGSPSEACLAADAWAVWRYATLERGVSPARIVVCGESLGGAVAVRLAAETCQAGSAPGGLLLFWTMSSLTDVGVHHYPWLPVRRLLVDRFESVARVGQVTCPIGQLHGRRDRIVPFELGQRLFDAAPARSAGGVEKRFVAISQGDHDNLPHTAEAEFSAEITRVFDEVRRRHANDTAAPARSDSPSP